MAMAKELIETPALGRPFQLGMLYDCRSDALIPGVTLWDYSSLQRDLTIKPQPKTESEILASDTIDDKLSALDISGSLKASFLGGLVEVGGSAKYLQDTQKSKQQARVTVQYKATTRYEQLTMSHLGIQNVSYPDIFEKGMATHVVTAILYGAQAFFVFDREVSSTEKVKTIKSLQGKLQATIKAILSLTGKTEAKLSEEEKENVLEFSCKFHGDYSLERNPVTFQDAVKVYETLPKLLGKDGEKAVPVRVWLYPLTKMDTKAAKLVREVSLTLIFDVEKILEELNEIQMQSNDLANDPIAETFPEIKRKILDFKDLCKQHRQTFQKELARVLPSIRGGGQEEGTLVDLLMSVNQSPFNSRRLCEFLDTKKREINHVKSYLTILNNIEVVSSQNNLEEIILDPTNVYVVSFLFTSLHEEEPFLLTLKDWLREQFLPGSAKSTRPATRMKRGPAWFEDREKTHNARQAAKSIQDFLSINQHDEEVRFVVASVTDVDNPGASIYLYMHGELFEKNFELPSQPLPFLVSEVRHDSIQLKFQPAEYGKAALSSYLVNYKVAGEENWRSVRTEDAREMFLLEDLLPNTDYQIQYAADCFLGFSKFSDTTAPIRTLLPGHPENLQQVFHLWEQFVRPHCWIRESELRIVLFGKLEFAKAEVGDAILGSQGFGSTLFERGEMLWKGRKVVVVDAPPSCDGALCPQDFMNILTSVELCPPGPHAIIHVLGTGLLEWSGSELVTRPFIDCISERNLNCYIILLFISEWDFKGRPLESILYRKTEMLKEYIAACGNRWLIFNRKAEGEKQEANLEELFQMIDDLVRTNHGAPYFSG